MRALKAAVVIMGVLIVVGVMTIGAVIIRRGMAPTVVATDMVLDEPAGTRIAGVSGLAERMAVRLEGGGPDRVVLIDLRSGRPAGRVTLAR